MNLQSGNIKTVSSSNMYRSLCPDTVVVNEKGEDEMTVYGYKRNQLKEFFWVYCATVLTLGFILLVYYWKPEWYVKARCSVAPFTQAQMAIIKPSHGDSQIFVTEIFVKKLKNLELLSHLISLDGGADGDRSRTASAASEESIDRDTVQLIMPEANYPQGDGDGDGASLEITCFKHQETLYFWESKSLSFIKLHGLDHGFTCNAFHEDFSGYSVSQQATRLDLYGQNIIDVEVKSYSKLLLEEVLNPFYIFQIFSFILWTIENYYYYAVCILVISAVSIGISLYETKKQARTLHDMVKHHSIVSVCREDDVVEEVDSRFLVPGDVIVIPPTGCVMSCDAVLLNGNCIVNESMLTGESVPVTKTPPPHNPSDPVTYSVETHKRQTLFCGTQVIQTRYYGNESVKALVVRTGFYTSKGELVRSILYPKPIGFKFYRDAMYFILLLFLLAIIGNIYSVIVLSEKHATVYDMIVKSLDVFTIAVPPALPAAMTVGTVYAQSRLKKKGIFCISPPRINVCGKLKLICFDKTGTLTEEGLDLWGVIPLQGERFLPVVLNVGELPRGPFLAAMATCHSLTIIDGQVTGDPLDLIMFESTNWLLQEPGKESSRFDTMMPTIVKPCTADTYFTKGRGDQLPPYEIGIIRQFPFSSSLQRMSVITRTLGASHMDLYVKGAPEMIASLCNKETVPADFLEVLQKYTQQGYRVLALAWRPLGTKVTWHQAHKLTRDKLECGLALLGLLVMQNALKRQTSPVIGQLRAAAIRTVMVTGDNILTALSVARDCHMVGPRDPVVLVNAAPPAAPAPATVQWTYDENPKVAEFSQSEIVEQAKSSRFHFAMTGKSFGVLHKYFPELIPKIVQRGTVFARMAPDQKAQLVEDLQEQGYCVGMCGDGANDCGALKTAHAGISLSEAEASVASPFTSKTANIECVPLVIREGRAALVTSFSVFKFMALYSFIQFITVLILYEINSNLGDWQFLYIDLFIITVLAFLMGHTGAYPHLVPERPAGSLVAPTIVFSLVVQILIQMAIQTTVYAVVEQQPWYRPPPWLNQTSRHQYQEEDERIQCYQNTVLFCVSSFQYIIVAVAFSKSKPFRKPLYTNLPFLGFLILMTAITVWLTVYPTQVIAGFMQLETDISFSFKLTLLGIAAVNFLLSVFLEVFVVDSQLLKRIIRPIRFCKKGPKNKYKLVEKEIESDPTWPPIGSVTEASFSNGSY